MPVELIIEDVPEEVAERLRERAQQNRRSLDEELWAILKAAVDEERAKLPAAAAS